jgi:hypothetical protein
MSSSDGCGLGMRLIPPGRSRSIEKNIEKLSQFCPIFRICKDGEVGATTDAAKPDQNLKESLVHSGGRSCAPKSYLV